MLRFHPKGIASTLFLRRGEELRVMIEKKEFEKQGFLNLFSIWKDKSEEEVDIYREIVKERELRIGLVFRESSIEG